MNDMNKVGGSVVSTIVAVLCSCLINKNIVMTIYLYLLKTYHEVPTLAHRSYV